MTCWVIELLNVVVCALIARDVVITNTQRLRQSSLDARTVRCENRTTIRVRICTRLVKFFFS